MDNSPWFSFRTRNSTKRCCYEGNISVILLPLICAFAWHCFFFVKVKFSFLAENHGLYNSVLTKIVVIFCTPFTPRWKVLRSRSVSRRKPWKTDNHTPGTYVWSHHDCRYKFPVRTNILARTPYLYQQHAPGLESSEDHSWSPSSSSVVEEGPLLMVGVDVRLPSDGGGGREGGRR